MPKERSFPELPDDANTVTLTLVVVYDAMPSDEVVEALLDEAKGSGTVTKATLVSTNPVNLNLLAKR
jgi:hypothetical protein